MTTHPPDHAERARDSLLLPFGSTAEDRAAKAIYDAIEPLSGDPIAVVLHMSDHLFWDNRLPGETDVDRQLAAVRCICRVAARAALHDAKEVTGG